jgi:predicted DNA-binding transcriptional regulator AlpA
MSRKARLLASVHGRDDNVTPGVERVTAGSPLLDPTNISSSYFANQLQSGDAPSRPRLRRAHAPRGAPTLETLPEEALPPFAEANRLLSKAEIVELTGRSYPTLWAWMQAGKFPRARDLHGRPVWVQREIQAFLASLPIKRIKGDADHDL